MANRFHRSKILVNRRLQFYIALHLAAFLIFCMSALFVDFYIYQEVVSTKQLADSLIQHPFPNDIEETSYYMMMVGYMLILLGLNLGFFYLLSLFISHRVAGPMINISRKLGEIEAGDLTQNVRLRKGDYLLEIEQKINDLTKSFCISMAQMQAGILALQSMDAVQTDDKIQDAVVSLEKIASRYTTK